MGTPKITLALSDLWTTCAKCDGTGTVDAPPPALGGNTYGSHRVYIGGQMVCEQCNGYRGKPTPTGEAIREFLSLVSLPRATA